MISPGKLVLLVFALVAVIFSPGCVEPAPIPIDVEVVSWSIDATEEAGDAYAPLLRVSGKGIATFAIFRRWVVSFSQRSISSLVS